MSVLKWHVINGEVWLCLHNGGVITPVSFLGMAGDRIRI